MAIMKKSWLHCTLIYCICGMPGTALAQGFNEGTKASVMLDQVAVDAGSSVPIHVHVNNAPDYRGQITGIFVLDPNQNSLGFSVMLDANKSDAVATLEVPVDARGGDYKLVSLTFSISQRTELKFDPISLTVRPIQKRRVPTSASIAFDPSEKQFLATNATTLKKIVSDLQIQLVEESADTPKLRRALIYALVKADDVFTSAIKDYPKLRDKSLNSPPFFLEDFHLAYQDALVGLKSSSTAAHYDELTNSPYKEVRIVSASGQAQKIPTHTLPLLAVGVIDRLNMGVKAFKLAEEKGSYFFDLEIETNPTGAKVYYSRLKHPYESLPSLTNIPKASFQYAFWTFYFEKDGCQSPPEVLVPYNDPSPKMNIRLDCHGRKKK